MAFRLNPGDGPGLVGFVRENMIYLEPFLSREWTPPGDLLIPPAALVSRPSLRQYVETRAIYQASLYLVYRIVTVKINRQRQEVWDVRVRMNRASMAIDFFCNLFFYHGRSGPTRPVGADDSFFSLLSLSPTTPPPPPPLLPSNSSPPGSPASSAGSEAPPDTSPWNASPPASANTSDASQALSANDSDSIPAPPANASDAIPAPPASHASPAPPEPPATSAPSALTSAALDGPSSTSGVCSSASAPEVPPHRRPMAGVCSQASAPANSLTPASQGALPPSSPLSGILDLSPIRPPPASEDESEDSATLVLHLTLTSQDESSFDVAPEFNSV